METDPYLPADKQAMFWKCLHECRHNIYKNKNNGNARPSYCTLELFHESVDPNTPVTCGRISKDGQQYECTHYGSYHIVFVIDKSSSMNGNAILSFSQQ